VVTQPRPAPVKPQPITDDPKVGQLYVTAGFWLKVDPDMDSPDVVREDLERELTLWGGDYGMTDLDVAVRVHGAGGEKSEDEGRWDR
jgi:hypothetical protein